MKWYVLVFRDNLYANDSYPLVSFYYFKRVIVKWWTTVTTTIVPTLLTKFYEVVGIVESLDILLGIYLCIVSFGCVGVVFRFRLWQCLTGLADKR